MDEAIQRKIRKSFADQSMMQTLGATLERIAPGAIEVSAPILPGARQQQGFAHAALTFALGDTAAGYSALSVMPQEAEVLTAEIKVNLLAPGRGDRLIARGRVLKPGRRLVVVACDVHAQEEGRETHIAALMGTMVPVMP